ATSEGPGVRLRKASRKTLPAPAAEAPATTSALLDRVVAILENARARVARSVNSEMVLAYWLVGREIVLEVQGGDARAGYGERVIQELSVELGARYRRGFSKRNLEYIRAFYLTFAERTPVIAQSVVAQ